MNMEMLKYVDHTLLTQTAGWEDIRQILDDAMKYGAASACIPAAYVEQAAKYVEGKLPVCTVIGFPNGYSTRETKVFETKIRSGAAIAEAPAHGESIFLYNPTSAAVTDYLAFIDEITPEIQL